MESFSMASYRNESESKQTGALRPVNQCGYIRANESEKSACNIFHLGAHISLNVLQILIIVIIIITDNFCIVLFSDVHKLTALYNTLEHFLSENKIIKGNNVHESNTEFWASGLRLNFLRG